MIFSIKKIYKKRSVKGLTIILILLFLGALWQYLMCSYESEIYAPPGQLIDVKDHKMHILAGIVLIDGGNPEYYADYNESSALALNFLFGGIRKSGVLRALGSVGIFPPLVGENERHKLLPEELRKVDEMMFYHNAGNEFNRNTLSNINENARKVIEDGNLGEIPLVILTAGQDDKWKISQVELKTWSSRSKQENIANATHYIHWSNSDVVIDNIRELIENSKENVH